MIPIEIKSAATITKGFAKSIKKIQKLMPKAHKGYVVYAGDFTMATETYEIINAKSQLNT